jgi:hypothetical protein
VLYNAEYFDEPVYGISRNTITIVAIGLYLLYYLIGFVRNYHFFLYTDNGSKLVFRFYSLRPLNKKQNAVEIDKTTFLDYKMESLFFGFVSTLYLFQKMPNGIVANYPPINITLLNKKEKRLLDESLKKYRQVS